MPRKVKIVQVTTHPVPPNPAVDAPGQEPRTRLLGVDAKGRVWERFSDMPPGVWGQIDPPDEPAQESKRRPRKR